DEDELVQCFVLLDAGQAGAVRMYVAVGVAGAVTFGRDRPGAELVQALVGEVGEVDVVAVDGERAAAVLVDRGAGRERRGQDVDGVLAQNPADDHLPASLGGAALVPVQGVGGGQQPAEGDGPLDQRGGSDG